MGGKMEFFSDCYCTYSFCSFLTNVGTHNLCANMKKLEQIFKILLYKFFDEFLQFYASSEAI